MPHSSGSWGDRLRTAKAECWSTRLGLDGLRRSQLTGGCTAPGSKPADEATVAEARAITDASNAKATGNWPATPLLLSGGVSAQNEILQTCSVRDDFAPVRHHPRA
jgi:hypothetical protein